MEGSSLQPHNWFAGIRRLPRGSRSGGRRFVALVAGLVLAVGMQFTLAFLPVGLVVAIVLLVDGGSSRRDRVIAVLTTGLGFLGLTLAVWAVTRANPFVVWWWNQLNHARFYVEYRRSYRAWVVANPIELAVAGTEKKVALR